MGTTEFRRPLVPSVADTENHQYVIHGHALGFSSSLIKGYYDILLIRVVGLAPVMQDY